MAVAAVALDILVDFVHRSVERVGHVRTVGDVRQGLFEDLGLDDVARRHGAHERLLLGQ